MVEARDVILLSAALLFLSGTAVATGIVNVNDFLPNNGGGSGDGSEPKYGLNTEITIQASSNGIFIDESSFNYRTTECTLLGCRNMDFSDLSFLAIGGANDVELTTEVYDQSGTRVGRINKFYGEVGAFQTRTQENTFDPLPAGNYEVRYRLTGSSEFLDIDQETTITKDVRVPETISSN